MSINRLSLEGGPLAVTEPRNTKTMDGAQVSVHTVSSARVPKDLNKAAQQQKDVNLSTGTGTCTRTTAPAVLVLGLVPVA
jgi:hypothetical protein